MLFTIPIAEFIAEYSIGCMGGTGGNERFVVADSVHMVDNKAFAHGKRKFTRWLRKEYSDFVIFVISIAVRDLGLNVSGGTETSRENKIRLWRSY